MKSINIIGCGRLGKTLGFLLAHTQQVTVRGICNTAYESSDMAVRFIGHGVAYHSIATLPAADIYLIGTGDDHITATCQALVDKTTPPADAIFMHCSGLLNSDALLPARIKGYAAASIHPIKSFADPKLSTHTFAGTFCATEGDARALEVLIPLFTAIGATCFSIAKKDKAIYHAAGVMANNYAVGLFAQAKACYEHAGIDAHTAHEITYKLFNDACAHLKTLSPEKALTGPLQRGDSHTIAEHLAALAAYPELCALYKILGLATLPLATLPEAVAQKIKTLLESAC